MPRKCIPLAARFWAKVCRTDDLFSCWEWTASTFKNGYGHFVINDRHWYAHRVAWEFENGPIPDGLFVLHHCDNKRCVRPAHLFLGTLADNNADMRAKGRDARGSDSPHAKVTEAQVREIRRRYAAGGISMKRLGREFDLSAQQVCDIVHRKRWRHLD